VWGYNKTLGTTKMPVQAGDPAIFTCETLIFDTFAPDTHAREQLLIEVVRSDGKPRGELKSKWSDRAGLLGAIKSALGPWTILGGAELGVDLLGLMIGRDIPVINLKQMRDTRYTERAVYQALVEAMLEVTKFRDAGLLEGDFTVKIRRCDSHQILKDFGFPTDGQTSRFVSVPSKLAFWVKLDFNAPVGKTVWTAR
jgi:hypothetical protein